MRVVVRVFGSAAASPAASYLASLVLGRVLVMREGIGSEPRGEQHAPVIVVMPIVVGNTVGNTFVSVPPRMLRALKRRARRRQASHRLMRHR